jgi:hypothetical protein
VWVFVVICERSPSRMANVVGIALARCVVQFSRAPGRAPGRCSDSPWDWKPEFVLRVLVKTRPPQDREEAVVEK